MIETSSGTSAGRKRPIASILGQLSVSEKQAQWLEVKAYTRWSPYLEKCCLLLSANESYERAAEDIQVLTGIAVSHSSQQRLVHRQTFALPKVEQSVDELSVDGGKVRLRTPKGQPSEWRDIGEKLSLCAICQGVIEKKLGTTSLPVRKRGYNQLNCWFSLGFDNAQILVLRGGEILNWIGS